MRRRSLDVEGFVKFPVHEPSSGEGGMLVKLWVIDRQAWDTAYGVCAGVSVADVVTESFMGTDRSPPPEEDYLSKVDTLSASELRDADRAFRKQYKEWTEQFFDSETYQVGCLLASIVMGSTGWSNSSFLCKYEDLTPKGQALYNQVAELYPKAEIHLATFLDT